jgi:hypothetical protein
MAEATVLALPCFAATHVSKNCCRKATCLRRRSSQRTDPNDVGSKTVNVLAIDIGRLKLSQGDLAQAGDQTHTDKSHLVGPNEVPRSMTSMCDGASL